MAVTTNKVFINAAYRTPIGKFGGALKKVTAAQLGSALLRESAQRTKMLRPDFVIMGQARQAGAGPNVARQCTIFAGLSEDIPALTINHACASGLSAIVQGVEKLLLAKAENLWVGGVESMSNTPYLIPTARWGQKLGNQKLIDAMYQDGFYCPMSKMLMGETVETFLASERNISRLDQDTWAVLSHQRACQAWENGSFDDEVLPFQENDAKLLKDEAPRADTTLESLAKLPAVFTSEGTLTAGNSSAIVDGAAFLWLSRHASHGALAEIVDYEITALDPKYMGLGPVQSIRNILTRNLLAIDDVETFEINEAFAAQLLACQKELKIPTEKLNVLGGAIALGHPIGASGARIFVTLAQHLKKSSGAYGVASLCVSGGQGIAVLIRAL